MIVFCEKCNSKFQVDDAKIPEAGVKGHCSVCKHVFLIKKQPVVEEFRTDNFTDTVVPPTVVKPVAEQKPNHENFDPGAAIFKAAVASPVSTASQTKPSTGLGASSFSSSASSTQTAEKPEYEIVAESAGWQRESNDQFAVNGSDEFEVVEDVFEANEAQDAGDMDDVFSENTSDAKTAAAYEAFTAFVERQKRIDEAGGESGVVESTANVVKNNTLYQASGQAQAKTVVETNIASHERHPADVVANGQWPARQMTGQKPDREIVTLLDQRGMTDDYIVQMVQEICQASKFVEGVEKPDWQTRIMGLEMLCKIKGLFPAEPKGDPSNRQVQIVTGINM